MLWSSEIHETDFDGEEAQTVAAYGVKVHSEAHTRHACCERSPVARSLLARIANAFSVGQHRPKCPSVIELDGATNGRPHQHRTGLELPAGAAPHSKRPPGSGVSCLDLPWIVRRRKGCGSPSSVDDLGKTWAKGYRHRARVNRACVTGKPLMCHRRMRTSRRKK
jgi:hypothetical protein